MSSINNISNYIPEAATLAYVYLETQDTSTLVFNCDKKPANFKPGQFNMIFLPGIGEVPISISGDPSQPEKLVHTIRNVGNVTAKILSMPIGSDLGFRGPYGESWPIEKCAGKDIVIIAGGIGLAPLRPVIYSLLANRNAYGKISLLYGARTQEDLLYRNQLEEWIRNPDIHVEMSVDKGHDDWHGHVGVITRLIPMAEFNPENSVSMICGPEIMIRYSIRELQRMGVKDNSIYVSMERNMKCGIGHCGHCQYGGYFVCKDGPVFSYEDVMSLMAVKEI